MGNGYGTTNRLVTARAGSVGLAGVTSSTYLVRSLTHASMQIAHDRLRCVAAPGASTPQLHVIASRLLITALQAAAQTEPSSMRNPRSKHGANGLYDQPGAQHVQPAPLMQNCLANNPLGTSCSKAQRNRREGPQPM